MTHVLTVVLTDEECRALHDLLQTVSHITHDPFGPTAGRAARVSASREILFKLKELLNKPDKLDA